MRNHYMEAVHAEPMTLRFVPAAVQMEYPEICMEAVRQNAAAAHFVADAVAGQYPEILEAAIDNPVYDSNFAPAI